MRSRLAALALLALAFLPLFLASSFVSDVLKETIAEIYQDAGTTLQRIILCAVHFEAVKDKQTGLFEVVLEGKHEDSDACLKFLKSLNGDINSLIADIQANHHAVRGHSNIWIAVSECIAEALVTMKSDDLKQISSKEALGYAKIMAAFIFRKAAIFNYWKALEKLSSNFTSSQWNSFVSWVIYTARPGICTVPPHLLHANCRSLMQIIALVQDISDVILGGQPFERNGLFRPGREVSDPSTIDPSYYICPIRCCDWDQERVGQLRGFLKLCFESFPSSSNIYPEATVETIPRLCQILTLLGDNPELATLAINCLVSNNFFDVVKTRKESLVDAIISTAYLNSEVKLKAALGNLNTDNKALAVSSLLTIKRNNGLTNELDALFESVILKLDVLKRAFQHISENSVEGLVVAIEELFDSVTKLPPNTDATRAAYAKLDSRTEYLKKLGQIISNPTLKSMRIGTKACVAKVAVIRYLLANSLQKLQFTAELAYALGCYARAIIAKIINPNMHNDDNAIRVQSTMLCKYLEHFMSLKSIHGVFWDTCKYIATLEEFTDSEFNAMMDLAISIFGAEATSKLGTCIVVLVKARLMKGGIMAGDYAQRSGFLKLPLKNSVYLHIILEWNADQRRRTKMHCAAFKAFVKWLIENNYLPRSIEMLVNV